MRKGSLVGILAVLASSATLCFAAGQLPLIRIGEQPKSVELSVGAKDLSVACPGAALRVGGSNGVKIGSIDRVGLANIDIRHLPADGLSLLARTIPDAQTLELSGSSVITIQRANPVSISVHTESASAEQSSDLLAAVQTQFLTDNSISGLLGAACQPAAADQWLIGAETLTGRESLLLLQNNTDLDSTADLEIFTEGGILASSGLAGISVPANDFTVVPLASLAPKAKTLAVHVISRGGAISSWIQQKTTRGLATGGADFISAAQPPATELAIPGLFIRGSLIAAQLANANSDYQDLAPSLHIFVPGDKDANVTAQVISSTANAFGTVISETIGAGKINRFRLAGLTDGDYALVVQSDQPVQAELTFSRVTSKKVPDIAFVGAAQAASRLRATFVPAGSISRLSLVNPSDHAVTVQLGGASSATLTIDKFSAAQVMLAAAKPLTVQSSDGVAAALVIDMGGALTVTNLLDYSNSASKVSVLVR